MKSENEKVLVQYFVKTNLKPIEAAQKLANEQGLGGKGRNEYATNVEEVKQLDSGIYVTLGFPVINFNDHLNALYQMVIGECHNIRGIKIKVGNIHFPSDYLSEFKGPKYGVDGIREKLQVYGRPLICAPVKPCIGLTPEEFAEHAYEAWLGGVDIVKHDELLMPDIHLLEEIVAITYEKFHEAIEKTGEQKLYVVNIGGSSKFIKNYLEIVKKYNVSAVMVSPAINGLDIAEIIPGIVFAHNSSEYALEGRIDFSVLAKLQRISGIDVKIMPAPYGSFEIMTEEEHKKNVAACLDDLGDIKSIFPAFTGSQGSDTIKKHYDLLGTKDFILVSGKKIFEHSGGIRKGAEELRKAAEKI